MNKKTINILENSFYLFAFVAIVAISVTGVIALNPVPIVDSNVAGLETIAFSQQNLIPVQAELLPEQFGFSIEKIGDGKYTVGKTIEKVFSGKLTYSNLIKLKNLNEQELKIQLNPLIIGQVSDILKIEIEDTLDVITLLKDEQLFPRTVTIPANSERVFSIKLESRENINFPFGIIIEVK